LNKIVPVVEFDAVTVRFPDIVKLLDGESRVRVPDVTTVVPVNVVVLFTVTERLVTATGIMIE